MVVAWHLVPPWPPTPLALDHGFQNVRIGDGMGIHHPHHLNMAASLREHNLKLTPIESFRHVATLPHHRLMTCHRSWWLVSNHCGFHTGRVGGCTWAVGPQQLYQAPVTLHAVLQLRWVHLGSADCIQPGHVAHVKVWAIAAHTSTHALLDLLLSSTQPHTPHRPIHPGGA